MTHKVKFGSIDLVFSVIYTDRKSLGITVTPENLILVKAPASATLPDIKRRLIKKAPWIIKQQLFFLGFHPKTPARKYIGGETHLYLGRQYRLKIIIGKAGTVKPTGRFIEVTTPQRDKVETLMHDWYYNNARDWFNRLAAPLIEKFRKHKVKPTSIVLREMPTRWGSCTARGKIILNPELIKAPKGCIEYVIIHELCHLIHHNHTQKFIDLQTKEMPDWEKWKNKLENLLA